jgi:hypothetical protein
MKRLPVSDERAVSTVVSHTIALGITSLLVLGLLYAGGAYLDDQRTIAAREGLSTVGSVLSEDVSQLDQMTQQGGTTTVRANVPQRVAGRSYEVRLRPASECTEPSTGTHSCLVLTTSNPDVTEEIPISIDASNIDFERTDPGQFRLRYVGSGPSGPTGGGAVAAAGVAERSLQVGIGRQVSDNSIGGTFLRATNFPPTNVTFRMNPEYPDSAHEVWFNATAEDPDADDPANPMLTYKWDLDGDGSYERTGRTVTYNYDSNGGPGTKDIALNVTDADNGTTFRNRTVKIAGLEYVDGSLQTGNDPDRGKFVSFEMINDHSSGIVIESLHFDPIGDGFGTELSNPDGPSDTNDAEIEIGSLNFLDSNQNEDFARGDDNEIEVPESGLSISKYYYIYDYGFDDGARQGDIEATVSDGDTVTIRFNGIDGYSGDEYVLGVQYRIPDGDGNPNDDETYINRFNTTEVSP